MYMDSPYRFTQDRMVLHMLSTWTPHGLVRPCAVSLSLLSLKELFHPLTPPLVHIKCHTAMERNVIACPYVGISENICMAHVWAYLPNIWAYTGIHVQVRLYTDVYGHVHMCISSRYLTSGDSSHALSHLHPSGGMKASWFKLIFPFRSLQWGT